MPGDVRPPGPVRPEHGRPVPLQLLADGAGLAVTWPDAGEHADVRRPGVGGPGDAGPSVSGVTIDSRDVRPGDLFAAVPGAHVHRADFAVAAVAAGAVAVLTDARGRARALAGGVPVLVAHDARAVLGDLAAIVHGRPADRLLTIAVTGTNGKTTTTYLLDAGLRAARHRTGLVGTIETRVDDRSVPSARTTPEATDLHALLAVMVEAGVSAVAMEASSHALALGRLGGLVVDVGLFTNLGRDHLDFHADLEDYFRAKARLLTPEHARAAVVNVDDPYGRRLAAAPAVPTTTFSARGADADWRASDVETGPHGSTFTALGPGGVAVAAAVRLPGAFNVENALGALVALVTAGVRPDLAAAGIASCSGVPGRVERVEAGQPFLAVVDYAHTPEAVETLLAAVRPLVQGRTLVVLGCGGDRDRAKRAEMGAAAARGADLVVVTDDNPRSEDPAAIRAEVVRGARSVPAGLGGEVVEIGDRGLAIEHAVALAGPTDAVVVAGKGHERGQELAGVVAPFDDRDALRTALEALRAVGGSRW